MKLNSHEAVLDSGIGRKGTGGRNGGVGRL